MLSFASRRTENLRKILFLSVIVVSFFAFVGEANAQAIQTWDGGGIAGQWNDPDNWNPGGTLAATDTAVIPNGVTATITSNIGNYTPVVLVVSSGGTLIVNQPGGTLTTDPGTGTAAGDTISVQGTLTMTDGNLYATGLVVRGGTINFGGGSHYIAGKDFQVESGTVNSNSATIQLDYSIIASGTANFTKNSGTFNAGTATYKFTSGQNQTISSNDGINFYNLEHSPSSPAPTLSLNSSTYTILNQLTRGGTSNGITVNSSLIYSNQATLRYSLGSARNVSGEWVSPDGVDHVINASAANVTLTSSRTIPSDGSLVLNQTGGNFIVSGVSTILTINGFLERKTAGTLGITTSGGSLRYAEFGSTLKYNSSTATTIGAEWPASGSFPPENVEVTINGGILSSLVPISRTVAQDLTLNVGTVSLGTGTLTVSGTVAGSVISGTAIISNSTTLFIGNGGSGSTHAQAITGNVTLNKLIVDKRNGANAADSTVTVSGILSFTSAGTLTVTQGNLAFTSPGALTPTFLSNLNLTIGSNGVIRTGGASLIGIGGTINTANGKLVFNGSNSAQETIPAWTLSRLEVNNPDGAKTSTGTTIVSQVLRLTNGLITTSTTNALRLGASAVVRGTPGATRMVVGPLRKVFSGLTTFTYPIGSGTDYRPATFQYTSGTVTNSIISITHSADGEWSEKTLPSGISEVQKPGHYIVREVGTAATGFTYAFTGTFRDGNFNPEDRNRILVETGTSYTIGANHSVNTVANTAYGDGFTALPTPLNYFIVFGQGGTNITWDGGGGDNSWFTGLNWSGDAVPGKNDYVQITGANTVNIAGDTASVSTLTLGDGANQAVLNIASNLDTLHVHDSGSGALTVASNSILSINNSGIVSFESATPIGAYDSSYTALHPDSYMEILDGDIEPDIFGNLTINGATGTNGNLTVLGQLQKSSATAFSSSHNITVTGNYTNTAGNATYGGTTGLTVNGNEFRVVSGVVAGTVNINTDVLKTNGGSFGGNVTFAGSAAQTINGTSNASFTNLVINNSNGVTIDTTVSVSTNLTLTSGIVNTTADLLTTAAVTGGSSSAYIQGPLAIINANGTHVFPVGKSVYRPLTATGITSTGTPIATVEVFDTAPGQSFDVDLVRISQVRYFSVILADAALTGGTVRLSYGSDDGVQNFDQSGDVVVAISQDNGSTDPYTNIGGEASGAIPNGFVTSVDIGTVPPATYYFTLGTATGDNSLPVELSSFTAKASFKEVTLTWTTQSELENEGFNLYRRAAGSGSDWAVVNQAMITGRGNTSESTNYEFIDRAAVAGNKYEYMLESISHSGIRVQEKIIEIDVPVPNEFALLGNYPNPFNPITNIKFQLPEKSQVTLRIYDIQGNLVAEPALNSSFSAGEHNLEWNATDRSGRNVASGMYIYLFRAGNFEKTGRMILLK